MSLKLIRNAQIATTTSKDILVTEHVREVLSKLRTDETVGPMMDIEKADYDRWMSVIADVARESNVTITKRTQLEDIALSVLDDDPKIESQPGDKEVLKRKIIDTLWHAYGASVKHIGVKTHIKKAREEEEMSGFRQDFKAAQGMEDEQKASPLVKAAIGGGMTNPYRPGSLRASLWDRLHGAHEDEEMMGGESHTRDPETTSKMDDDSSPEDRDMDSMAAGAQTNGDAAEVDPEHIEGEDEIDPDAELEDNDSKDQDPEDLLSDLSTDELEAELARRKGEDSDDGEMPDQDVDAQSGEDMSGEPAKDETDADQSDDKDKPAADHEDGESAEDIAKRVFSDEESTRNFFRTAVTKPSQHIKAALADVGKEAELAWHNLSLPKNPHPKQSPAHREWDKSFKNIAKNGLGIKDPKALVTSKLRKR
jgi:hypothetical protein